MILIAEAIHDAQRLKELQVLPLERKIQITQTRIIEWYQHYSGQVCVSFSGGKDSTVLLHIARKIYPDIPAVFDNTGLEYPEIQRFVKSFDNVDIITPDMRFDKVISTYGYPLISKEVAESIHYARKIIPHDEEKGAETTRQRITMNGERTFFTPARKQKELSGERKITDEKQYSTQGSEELKSWYNKEKYLPLCRDTPFLISHYCCYKMKKGPMHIYQTQHKCKPILATLAEESRMRKQGWIRHGCNAFEGRNPKSQPMSFWTEQDILSYIAKYNVEIASVYGNIVSTGDDWNEYPAVDLCGNPNSKLKCTGCQRTGCIFCGFGFHNDKGETRFQRLAKTHPRQYEYSIGGGQWVDNPHYDPTAPEYEGNWKNWNPKQIWVPSKKGLGMGKVFDMVNEIYGKDFYRYE